MNKGTTNRPKKLLFWLKMAFRITILVLVSWGIWRTVGKGWDEIANSGFSIRDLRIGWLVVAGMAYLLGMLPCGLFWYRTLQTMGQRPRLGPTLRAFYIGHLGKYVPGKMLVVVIRTRLIRGSQVDTTVAATSVFIETLTMMAVGAAVAAVILGMQFRQQPFLLSLALFLACCAGGPTLPPIFRRIVSWLQVHRASEQVKPAIASLNFRLMAYGWATVTLGWIFFGLSLWATLQAIPGVDVPLSSLPLLTASASLAMVAGFLSLVPAGAGVREFVIMRLVKTPFGELAAVGSAVLLRLVWLAAELLLAGVLYVAIRDHNETD